MDCDNEAQVATFWRLEKRGENFYRHDLGKYTSPERAGNPYLIALWGFYQFLPTDAAILALHQAYILREIESAKAELEFVTDRLGAAVAAFL